MIKKAIKNEKGITLLVLMIAIIIMLIITSTIIFNISTGNKVKALKDMYQDITILKDKVELYDANYHTLPILETKYENISHMNIEDPNNSENYYVIDLTALENMTLHYGKDYETYKANPSNNLTDLYMINEKSHKIYYIKGIQFDNNMYYTIPDEDTKIEGKTIVNLEIIARNKNLVNVQMYAVNKEEGIKTLKLMIDGQVYKSYQYTSNLREARREIEQIDLEKSGGICYLEIEDEDGNITTSDQLQLKTILSRQVEVGDYVAYDPTRQVGQEAVLSYTSPKGMGNEHGNGYSAQTFTANSDIRWRVLNVDEETKEVLLISDKPIKTDEGVNFFLEGAIGYLYAEQELNEICKIYGYGRGANTITETYSYQIGDTQEGLETMELNGSGARSINVEDINSITKANQEISDSGTCTVYSPTRETQTGYTSEILSKTYVTSAYSYEGFTYMEDKLLQYKMLFRNTNDSGNVAFWLASRCVERVNANYVQFGVRNITNGTVNYSPIGYGYNTAFNKVADALGVRPIVKLKAGVQTSGKDLSNAWTIAGVYDKLATKMRLNESSITMSGHTSEKLTVSVEPENVSYTYITWTSSNPSVVKVSKDGTVTAVGIGTATITAKIQDGSGLEANCEITVE